MLGRSMRKVCLSSYCMAIGAAVYVLLRGEEARRSVADGTETVMERGREGERGVSGGGGT